MFVQQVLHWWTLFLASGSFKLAGKAARIIVAFSQYFLLPDPPSLSCPLLLSVVFFLFSWFMYSITLFTHFFKNHFLPFLNSEVNFSELMSVRVLGDMVYSGSSERGYLKAVLGWQSLPCITQLRTLLSDCQLFMLISQVIIAHKDTCNDIFWCTWKI